MAGSLTWRGGGGAWNAAADWNALRVPGATDAVTIDGVVTLDHAGVTASVTLLGGTLDVAGALSISGTLAALGGTLDLSGTLRGGTLLPGGLHALGGTLDGVTLAGGLTGLGNLTIIPATAALNAAAPIAPFGSLTLAPGDYADARFLLDAATLAAASGAAVSLGPNSVITLAGEGDSLAGAGRFVDRGSIGGAAGAVTIAGEGFTNAGSITLTSVETVFSNSFPIGRTRFGGVAEGVLTWTQAVAPTLAIAATQFDNVGTIRLTGTATQSVQEVGGIARIVAGTASSTLVVAAAVADFANAGTIAADAVVFENTVTLDALGAITGQVTFAGTLDLGGGTLESAAVGGVTITGTVRDGSIAGRVTLDGATLDAVTLGGAATVTGPITLIDPVAARVTLDATTTELALSVRADCAVTALNADTLTMLGASLTLGAGFSLTAPVAGSTVDLSGAGMLTLAGRIDVSAATLIVAPTLSGSGTITLADGAAATLEALAPGAALRVDFGAGPALLVLPTDAAGITLVGQHAGDIVQGVTAADALPTVACFRAGTRIAVPGGERPVERLTIGDMVLTAGGAPRRVKWLGRRRYAASLIAAQRQLRPVRIAPGALGGGLPRRALEVSPEHALLIGGCLVPAGALFDARAEDGHDVTYIHVELAAHELLLAEGVAAESFVPLAGRMLFDNAAEYTALYPDDAAPAAPLPRIVGGPVVARLRVALHGRPPRRPPGTLRGHVERIAGGVIEGWACDDGAVAVRLTVLADGVALGGLIANRYRADLDHYGLPACGFRAAVPPGAVISLWRGDGAELPICAGARVA